MTIVDLFGDVMQCCVFHNLILIITEQLFCLNEDTGKARIVKRSINMLLLMSSQLQNNPVVNSFIYYIMRTVFID